MAKKPVTTFVDPTVETTITIKPFAAGLATALTGTVPNDVSGSVTGTNAGQPHPDVDADVDYVDDDN